MRICREEMRRERTQNREKKEMRRAEENKDRDEKQRLFIHKNHHNLFLQASSPFIHFNSTRLLPVLLVTFLSKA